jgi:hypothetical protein
MAKTPPHTNSMLMPKYSSPNKNLTPKAKIAYHNKMAKFHSKQSSRHGNWSWYYTDVGGSAMDSKTSLSADKKSDKHATLSERHHSLAKQHKRAGDMVADTSHRKMQPRR